MRLAIEIEKDLDNYIKCLEKKIKSVKHLATIAAKHTKNQTIPLEWMQYWAESYKSIALEMVLEDLKEIIVRQKEQEREEDNSVDSVWKDWGEY